MAKVNFLKQGESLMLESYNSQLHDNANKKPENEGTLFSKQ